MILFWLIVIPLLGGAVSWWATRWNIDWARWTAVLTLSLYTGIVAGLGVFGAGGYGAIPGRTGWVTTMSWDWLPSVGIGFALALDGLSLLLLLLTGVLGLISVIVSWEAVTRRVGFYHFCLLGALSGVTGVFLAMDLFFFFFFWELMIVPMYFLIGIWGHEGRENAARKFFLFTQAGGLILLVAILGLVYFNGQLTGVQTFRYETLLEHAIAPGVSFWLMLGFLVAFLVKLPAVPFHTWLADAHSEAPTAGSVLLAGLFLKTGAYGLMRFAIPLFPEAAGELAPTAMGLGVISILYGAKLAFAQRDVKRLVAYTSISHMGFVLLGIFAWNLWALQGVVMQLICHGLSTGALFIIAGALQDRLHTRDMEQMGGLWRQAPRLAGVGLFFALATLGLPGLGNFVGELLILVGAYAVNRVWAAMAVFGLVAAAVYSLWLVQRVFHGEARVERRLGDLTHRETAVMVGLIVGLVWLGLRPQAVLDTARPALEVLQRSSLEVSGLAFRPGD
jgi:NADH-quinone oxidoreductase subunit M